MKQLIKISIVLVLLVNMQMEAQVAIGKSTVSASGILEFASNSTRGILLPIVEQTSNIVGAVGGTLIFDDSTATFRFFNGTLWSDISTAGTPVTPLGINTSDTGGGIIIGAPSSTARGALVLESPNKALILPLIMSPAISIISPVKGMLCYDLTTKSIAMYNGVSWSYFK